MSNVGSVSVDVVGDVSRFGSRLRSDLLPEADRVGREIGKSLADSIAKGIKFGIGDGLKEATPEATRKGRESGDAFGGEFARQVQSKIRAALASLPKVDITADSSDAERKIAELRASLAELSEKRIGVDVDAAAALAEVNRIRTALSELARTSPDVKVRVDAGRAAAELDALKANLDKLDAQKVEVKVAAETAAAEAKLEAAKLKADELDRKKVQVKVDADTAAAESKLSALTVTASGAAGGFPLLVAAGLSIGPAIIPVAAAAVAAIAAIGTAATGAAAGFGVAILAIKPVIGAVTALAAADTSAAADAAAAASAAKAKANAIAGANAQVTSSEASLANARASAASAAVNAADRVQSSETALGNTRASVASAAVTAAERVKSSLVSLSNAQASAASGAINAADRVKAAEASLANARASAVSGAINAADRVKAAEAALANTRETVAAAAVNAAQRVSDAQRGLADAETQAAQGVQTALGQVTSAERTLAQAQQAELAAQQALTDARKSAAQQLQDYQTQLADGALSQRAALLSIQSAKQNLDKVNATGTSTQLQRDQAQLAYDQAVQHNIDLGIQQQRLKASAADAARAGVEGSKQVVAAKTAVSNADQNIANAQATLGKAEAGVTAARVKGAEQVAKAQEAIGTAQRAQADQARLGAAQTLTAAQAVANAQRAQVDQARQGAAAIVTAAQAVAGAQRAQADQARLGAAQTLTAAQAVANAQRAQVDQARQGAAQIVTAQQAVENAQRAQTDQARQGAASIAAAQQSVANAQRSLAAAYAQTNTAGLTTANNLAQAFQNLSPVGADFARFIYGLKDSLVGLSKAAQDGLLPGLRTFIEALLPALPAVTRFVGELAKVMGDLFVEASKALSGPFWMQFFSFISGSAAGWLRTFAETFGQLVKGAAGLFQALAPVADLFNGYLLQGATAFANWATSLGQNTGFQTFLGYIKANLPPVLGFLGDLGRLVGHILVALAPLGPVILQVVDDFVKFLLSIDPKILGQIAFTVGVVGLAFAGLPGILILVVGGLTYALTHFEGFRDTVINAFISIRAIVLNAWESYIKPALGAMWMFIRDTLIPVFQQVWAVIENAWVQHIQPALQALAAFIKERVVPAVRGIIDAIKGFLDVALPIVIQFVEGMWARIEPLMPQIRAIFKTIGDIIVGALDLIKVIIQDVTKVISFIWTNFGQGIMDWIGVVFRAVIGIVGPALDTVKSVIKLFTDVLHGSWSAAWQDVKDILSHSWDLIKGVVSGALDIVKQLLSTAWSVIKTVLAGAWQGIVDTFGGIWDTVLDKVKGPINAVLTFIRENFIKPLNEMLKAVFGDGAFQIPFPNNIVAASTAPRGKGGQGYAVGGPVGGYSPHDRADNIPAWLTAEEFILPVAATRALRAEGDDALLERLRTWNIGAHADGGLVRGYADGGSVWDTIRSGITSGFGLGGSLSGTTLGQVATAVLGDPLGAIKSFVSSLLSGVGGSGVFPELAKGALGKFGDGLAEKVKSLLSSITGTGTSAAGGGVPTAGQGSAAFEGWWSQAVGINPALAPYHAAAVITARNESGFNPSIFNRTDINARAGTPSAGLMQFIESTFRANAWPGYNNWLGAVDQILAWKTYADRRYHGPNNLPGVRGTAAGTGYAPYAEGGFVKPILLDQLGIKMPVFDTGGTLMPGPNLVYNGTGGLEDLAPARSGEQGMSGGGTFHLYDVSGVLIGTMRGEIARADRASQLVAAAGSSVAIR